MDRNQRIAEARQRIRGVLTREQHEQIEALDWRWSSWGMSPDDPIMVAIGIHGASDFLLNTIIGALCEDHPNAYREVDSKRWRVCWEYRGAEQPRWRIDGGRQRIYLNASACAGLNNRQVRLLLHYALRAANIHEGADEAIPNLKERRSSLQLRLLESA